MRITEKNTPVLKLLRWKDDLRKFKEYIPKLNILRVPFKDMKADKDRMKNVVTLLSPFIREWKRYQQVFTHEVIIASKPFTDAAVKNADKILTATVLESIAETSLSGTLICDNLQFCYRYNSLRDGDDDWESLVLDKYGQVVFIKNKDGHFISSLMSKNETMTLDELDTWEHYFEVMPVLMFLFRRYADIEIVESKPFKKVNLPEDEDSKDKTLLVDFELPIKYMDCSWFRTIVRKEGFMVRGHFRMQPYKNEKREWDYKLIYIEPFQKHGYTRTAKKVVEARRHNNELAQ